MTEERPTDRERARRVSVALGDLFDSLAPTDRAAAEDELRDAGLDPARVAARTAQLAADRRAGSHAQSVLAHPRAADSDRQQHAVAIRAASTSPRIPRQRTAALRIAAALVIGIAVGWAAARVARLPNAGMSGEPLASNPVDSAAQPAGGAHPNGGGEAVNAGPRRGFSRDTSRPREPSRTGSATPSGQIVVDNRPPVADAAPAETGGVDESAPPEELAAGADPLTNSGEAAMPTSWILERRTWERGQDLLPAPVLARVRSGAIWFEVQDVPDKTFRANYSREFWAATRANAQRMTITPKTCSLQEVGGTGFPATLHGLPFPAVDAASPTAACEVMWNTVAARSIAGGMTGALLIDRFPRDTKADRLQMETRSAAYLDRPAGFGEADLLSATRFRVTAPPGTGIARITFRYRNSAHQDDMWWYQPDLRRVGRMPAAQRSEPFANTLASADFDCFNGKLEEFEWRLLGTGHGLAPIIASGPPKARIAGDHQSVEIGYPIVAAEHDNDSSAPWHFVENLTTVPRPVWVIEGRPREDYLVSKVVLYVDAAMYRIYWSLVYGRDGELLKDMMCAQQWWRSEDGSVRLATTGAMSIVAAANGTAKVARYTSQALDFTPPPESEFSIAAMVEAAK